MAKPKQPNPMASRGGAGDEWDDGPHAKLNTQEIVGELEKATLDSGWVAQHIGNIDEAMASAVTRSRRPTRSSTQHRLRQAERRWDFNPLQHQQLDCAPENQFLS